MTTSLSSLSAGEDTHRFGISHYKALHGCIKRYGCEAESDGGPDAAFGTHLHSWLAAYHTGSELPVLSEEIPEKAYVSEAELARRYASRFSPKGFGKPLLVEERLTTTVPMPNVFFETVEILQPSEPFVGTLDLVVDVDDEAALTLEAERGITIEPGLWLVDHKTKIKKPQGLVVQYLGDPQFTGYQRLWRDFRPSAAPPLKGTLVNVIFRYKDDRPEGFLTLVVPAPDRAAEKVWLSVVKEGAARLREKGPDFKDPTRCFDFARVCPCFDDCDRSNI